MTSISGSFDDLWNSGLSDSAKRIGLSDADLATIRSAVKGHFIAAGWADQNGNLDFVSDADAAFALGEARKIVDKKSKKVQASRKLSAHSNPSNAPTKTGISASTGGEMSVGLLDRQNVSIGSFSPKLAVPGDACPRCNGTMEAVVLANSKGALYCPMDRVVVPT